MNVTLLVIQDFWVYLGYILSFLSEVFNLTIIETYSKTTGDFFTISLGQVIFYSILIPVIIHLLVPSAKGI